MYIAVFLFLVIWFIYSSNKMKTLDRILNNYENEHRVEGLSMQDIEYLFEKKGNHSFGSSSALC